MDKFASSLYTGYSYGVAPMLSFYHGEQNHGKLKKLVGISMKVIAGISVLTVAASFLLTRPLVFGVNGIWLATPVAELMALALSAFLFLKYRKRYGY